MEMIIFLLRLAQNRDLVSLFERRSGRLTERAGMRGETGCRAIAFR